ncbi:MAG: hypothetical protein E5299_02529 [Burkholderia gladioli]|nr:MAG: hypothetical protein E5299_02529 [Burkholderia gladioli]
MDFTPRAPLRVAVAHFPFTFAALLHKSSVKTQ